MRRWCARTTEERRDSHGLTERTGQERTPSTCLVPKERVTPGTPEKRARRGPCVHFVCQKAVEILLLIPRKKPLYTKASLSSIPPRSHRFLSNREKLRGGRPGFRGSWTRVKVVCEPDGTGFLIVLNKSVFPGLNHFIWSGPQNLGPDRKFLVRTTKTWSIPSFSRFRTAGC